MNQVVTFEQRVKARISEVAAELIPAEDLEDMVRSQVAHFRRTELPEMVKTLVREQFKLAAQAELAKPEYMTQWAAGGTQVAGEAIRKIITENASQMLASLVGTMVQQTVYQMQQNLPRY